MYVSASAVVHAPFMYSKAEREKKRDTHTYKESQRSNHLHIHLITRCGKNREEDNAKDKHQTNAYT